MNTAVDIPTWYDQFNTPVTEVDCGQMCAPNNPTGKPFCCDICQAVPAAYNEEWDFLQPNTNLWKPYSGLECSDGSVETTTGAPEGMIFLACLGPDKCERDYRAISCRQFPFFPYITSDFRFIGLAYEWAFEETCWVINNLHEVTEEYRKEFVTFYDRLFEIKIQEMESYSRLSEEMRDEFSARKRRIPLLHRNGQRYLISPGSERARKI
jgi:hypothetical protein